MKIKRQKFKNKIFPIGFLKIFDKFENNYNSDFSKNGEERLMIEFVELCRSKNDAPIIFDVGANVGAYTDKFIKILKEVNVSAEFHLFEPMIVCYDELKERFKNSKEVSSINNFALSDIDGQALIYSNAQKSPLASLYKRTTVSNVVFANETKIFLRRLDSFIKEKDIRKINFLKIDVEGHELAVLRGLGEYLSYNFIDYIQFEYGGSNLDSHTTLQDFYQLLESKGFVICKIFKKFLQEREYDPNFDNFRYSNYVAVSKKIIDPFLVK